jgi:hypothetical protein
MKVKELISLLELMDPDSTVMRSCASGDYWGSTLAIDIDQVFPSSFVAWSSYHGQFKVPDSEDFDPSDYEGDEQDHVVLLS